MNESNKSNESNEFDTNPMEMPVLPKSRVRPGMRFMSGNLSKVVRKHETLPETWWCRNVNGDTGLWAYHETTILRNLRTVKVKKSRKSVKVIRTAKKSIR